MKYPKIERDTIDFESDTEVCNVGFYEGKLSDGRPIRVELWLSYEILNATIFISIEDLEEKNENDIKKYLMDEKIINVIEDNIYITEIEDINENIFLSINVPISDHGNILNQCLVETEPFM